MDGRGVPLSIVVEGANRHDVKLLGQTLESGVMKRPAVSTKAPQHYVPMQDTQARPRGG